MMEAVEGVPDGGYVLVSVTGLLAAWWAYKRGFVQFRDFRVWLACHELLAQRCGLEKGVLPRFRTEELKRRVGGVGGEHLRASVRRLEAAGLLSWSESRISLAHSTPSVRVGDSEDLALAVEGVRNHKRKVPVPRRLLNLLCRERRPVFVATALGHLLRCMYFRNGRCRVNGLCKASWIASVFEVDLRNVKAARKELVGMKVLLEQLTTQYKLNRYGVPMQFNLHWGQGRETPPRMPQSTTEIPPPRKTEISSLRRSENQKPGAPDPSGVRTRTGRGPNFSRVLATDLKDPKRLLVLLDQARRQRYIGGSESDRLKFFAAAEHAVVYGRQNPAGLFATVVRRGLWDHLTLKDEDRGRRLIRSLPALDLPGERVRENPVRQPCTDDPERVRELIARSLDLGTLSIDR